MVQLIFRKDNRISFSIEKVFHTILPFIREEIKVTVATVPSRAASPIGIWKNIKFCKVLKGDVFHMTGDVHYAVLAFPGNKTILTIHDCVFLFQSKGIKRIIFKWLWLKWPIRHAAIVTTISEKSKSEIIEYSGCPPEKILVVPNPVDPAIKFSRSNFNSREPSILFIGTKPNKNLERSILALSGIKCNLHIVGKLSSEQLSLLNENNILFTNHISVSDERMRQLYTACDIVLFPTTYEGFGLPILEAQQTGRIIVSSMLSPMKEVAGGGAHLVDPFDVNSIRLGVLQVINDPNYRNLLIEAGKENASKYQASVVAQQYVKLYHSLNCNKPV